MGVSRGRGFCKGERVGTGGRTEGAVDLDALDAFLLSISWGRHVG